MNETRTKAQDLTHDYVDIDKPLDTEHPNNQHLPEDTKTVSKREAPSPPQNKSNPSNVEEKTIARTISDSIVSEKASLNLLVKTKSLEIVAPASQENPRFKEAPNHNKMARTSSRADEEQGSMHSPPFPSPPKISEGYNNQPKLQNDFAFIEQAPQELVLKTEPEPNKAVIEPRSPSPVKIVNTSPTQPSALAPPSYSATQSSIQMPDVSCEIDLSKQNKFIINV